MLRTGALKGLRFFCERFVWEFAIVFASLFLRIARTMRDRFLLLCSHFLLLFMTLSAHAIDIHQFETQEPVVCLTFDDGPLGDNTERLRQILAEHGAKATFFVNSMKIPGAEASLKSLYKDGHEIGNHTATHPGLPDLESEGEIRAEIVDCQQAVIAVTGKAPAVFRAPFLAQDERVRSILRELELPSIFCSADTRDWDATTGAETILQRAVDGLQPGAIILMHEFRDETADILPALLEAMDAKGLRAVTVSQAMAIQ